MQTKIIEPYVCLKLRYLNKATDEISDLHSHDFYQLTYVTFGCGNVRVGNKTHTISQGNIFIIPPDINHNLFSPDSTLTTYELKFSITDEKLAEHMKSVGVRFYNENDEIAHLIKKTVSSSKEMDSFSKLYAECLISQIIIQFLRIEEGKMEPASEKAPTEIIRLKFDETTEKIKAFIDKNYCQKISIQNIADEFFISPSGLYKKFINVYGISPLAYINDLRINKAKILLENSSSSVTEISEALGFSSIHYFSRCFAHKVKMTPSEYRYTAETGYVVSFD